MFGHGSKMLKFQRHGQVSQIYLTIECIHILVNGCYVRGSHKDLYKTLTNIEFPLIITRVTVI